MGTALFAAAAVLVGLHGQDDFVVGHGPTPGVRCLKALAPLAADTVPHSDNFAPVDCPHGEIAAAFRYDDAQGASRVSRAVAADEIVPIYPEFGIAMILPGQTLRLVVNSGAARIERQVEA